MSSSRRVALALAWVPGVAAALAFCGHAWLPGAAPAAPLDGAAPPVTSAVAALLAAMPIGDLAYRHQLAGAVGAAIAVWLAARLVVESGKDDAATAAGALAAAGLAAAAYPMAAASTHAAAATWAAALVAAALLLGYRVALGSGAAAGLGAALVFGLAVAADPGAALIALPLAVLLILRLRRGARWPLAAPTAFALAFAAALAQPLLRAGGGPPHTLGELAALRWPALAAPPPLAPWADAHGDAIGPLGLVAALVGAAALLSRRTLWLGLALPAALIGAIGLDLCAPAAPAATAALGVAVLAGAGVARVARTIPLATGQAAVGGALAVILTVSAALTTVHRLAIP